MTARARISKPDMDRVTKSVAQAGYANARFIFDFEKGVIEAIVGDTPDAIRPENPLDRKLLHAA